MKYDIFHFSNTAYSVSLSRCILFLFFTFNFSLFTFHLGAQGLTRYGESTSSSANFVDKNGKIGSSAVLNKYGLLLTVPGAPTIGTATAGDGQVTVTFTAPAFNGGSTITSYTATSTPDGFTGILTQAGSGTITVTGLTNLTAYTFTVKATNAVGAGNASGQSNSVIQGTATSLTGKVWIDRNLGASQVATSSTDALAYGDFYQWGRGTDGHQIRTSITTGTLSNTDAPGHGNFILSSSDWRSPQNDNLWQGTTGTNNPCPSGFRIPTDTELIAERSSWGSQNAAGAFASPLKWSLAGFRYGNNGSLAFVDSRGYYWSSTVNGSNSNYLVFESGSISINQNTRNIGFSVRCIKAGPAPDAPTIGTATAGNAQASVTFTAPVSDGGSEILAYTVTSSTGGFTGTGTTSPISVTGLANGTAYTFTVTATNANGISAASSASNSVTPVTTPGAPSIGTATAGNAQASVSFTAPASNGGSTITSYTATSSPGSVTGTLTQAGSGTITVTGLTNGTAYTFTVTATNGIGTSAASSPSSSVTPATIPGAPTIGTATAGDGQVTVTFTAPVSNGGSAITGYTVTSSPGGLTGTGSASPITVTGLTNLTAYTFTVIATNAVGTGTASGQSNSVIQGTVTSSTGKIWMDRNLGASQVATSSTDAASYGDLYQWGRYDDGHQIRTSSTTSTLGNAEDPRTSAFIMASNNDDWSVTQYDNLWQDAGLGRVAGDPCPIGYRLPTSDELVAERASWSSSDAAGAFSSPLKLPVAGYRASVNGVIYLDGRGFYWSKTVSGTYSEALYFGVTFVGKASYNRASGMSVRCIKN